MASSSESHRVPVVTTPKARITGFYENGISCFKGIPYAEAVDGLSRWLPPESNSGEQYEISAINNSAVPLQSPLRARWFHQKEWRHFVKATGCGETPGDNCLSLNIWTPMIDRGAKLPVMFWIHGGSYVNGSGAMPHYSGTILSQQKVVVVTINYRLGLPGFLAGNGLFDGDICIANRGLLDQILALNWVRENIQYFGGDPDCLTVFGESAGGTSIAALLASPQARGLFRRAIIQSGIIEQLNAPLEQHLLFTEEYLKGKRVHAGDESALARLETRDLLDGSAQRLLRAKSEMYGELGSNVFFPALAYGDETLPKSLMQSLREGAGKDVDVMIGCNADEMRLMSIMLPGPKSFSMHLMSRAMGSLVGSRDEQKFAFDRYRELLPGQSSRLVRERIFTDFVFRRDMMTFAELRSSTDPELQGSPTYVYEFDWKPPRRRGDFGAMHTLDIGFVFGVLEPWRAVIGEVSEAERSLARTMSAAWVSFARTGVPSTERLPDWVPYDTNDRFVMKLGRNCVLSADPYRDFRGVWDACRRQKAV